MKGGWLRDPYLEELAMPRSGDIFAAKLPDGRYRAVRVIKTVGKSSLVCTTPYLGAERPSLDDPQLHETVTQVRFLFKGQPAREWLDGPPPACFELVGNIPASKAEREMECNVYGGKWSEYAGNEVFLEWRWLHDRPAFEEEVRKQRKEFDRRRRLPQTPGEMMSEEEFWLIIDRLDWEHQGNDQKVLAPAIKALAAKSTADICRFEERFAFLLYQLDTRAHASNIGEYSYDPESDYVSADGFLYARCVVVANGRGFYETVLRDPVQMPKDMEFESLLYLAPKAYELKTGDDFDYATGCSYESFSNQAGWPRKA
jgi:hypothetical protein